MSTHLLQLFCCPADGPSRGPVPSCLPVPPAHPPPPAQTNNVLQDAKIDTQTSDEQFDALTKYGEDLTAKAARLDPVIGRWGLGPRVPGVLIWPQGPGSVDLAPGSREC